MEKTAKQLPKLIPLVKGLIVAYLITGAALVLLAFLVFKMNLNEGKVNAAIVVIYILSCFFGGFFVGKKAEKQKFFWGMILGLIYFLLLTAVSALTEPGLASGWKGLLTSFVMCMGSGMLGGMFS